MPCTDPRSLAPLAHRRALVLLPAASALLSACGLMGGKADTAAPAPAPAPQPTTGTTPPAGEGARAAAAPAPATGAKPATAAAKDAPPAAPVRPVAPMPLARNWEDYKRQAARRIVAANPDITHTGVVQQPALAIPVLEIEVAGDGSIVRVDVLRPPREARHTVQIAIDAVRRAGPLPPVAHLPKPWKFTESFLFNDDGRFKPSALNR